MDQIRIGVTGHRDLRDEDLPVLRERIQECFEKVKKAYPRTSYTLLTPLAEGADRLAAETALESGIKIIALLPMPMNEYQDDFETTKSLKEYRQWLKQADRIVEIPLATGNTLENIKQQGEHRAMQYVFLGAYLAKFSHILLALWNGEEPKLKGGTAEVVQFKLTGIPEQCQPTTMPFQPVDGGGVYHVVTPRFSNPTTVGEPFTVKELSL